jgi:hypothetical protein
MGRGGFYRLQCVDRDSARSSGAAAGACFARSFAEHRRAAADRHRRADCAAIGRAANRCPDTPADGGAYRYFYAGSDSHIDPNSRKPAQAA